MQLLLKKLYVRRMAADLGITKIYASGKTVHMAANMTKKVFKIMTESMASDVHRNCLTFVENEIKVHMQFYYHVMPSSKCRIADICICIMKIVTCLSSKTFFTKGSLWLLHINDK